MKFMSMDIPKKILPKSKEALILIKPNFNSDMCGLTGNTTDLRLVVGVIKFLKKKGYSNIVVADGTSSGFITSKIDVLKRLGIKRLGKHFGVKVMDLNKAPHITIPLGKREKIKVARICFKCSLFINMPKLKTHAEAGVSACKKNLMGCITGLDKQKMHHDLEGNIDRLSGFFGKHVKIYNVVDAIIAMEGTGPSRGIPKRNDTVYMSPFLDNLDAYCKFLVRKNFKKPEPSLSYKIINSKLLRKYFAKLRYISFLNPLFTSKLTSKILYKLGARQDLFNKQDAKIKKLYIDGDCGDCDFCDEFCPIELNVKTKIDSKDCIRCLYCYLVCPSRIIKIDGDLGYFSYQAEKYGDLIRKVIHVV